MKKKLFSKLLRAGLVAAVLCTTVGLLTGSLLSGPAIWKEGRILVKPRAGLSEAEFDLVIAAHGGKSHRRLGPMNAHVVELPDSANEVAVMQALSRNPKIEFAELDGLLPPGEIAPNDPYYGSAWHLATMSAPSAWDYALGSGVIVAVLDTGVDPTHPDLAGQLVPGWNMWDDSADSSDVYGHGTKVAGVVAALSNNNMGVTSLAWNASVMPVRISRDDGWAYYSTIAAGLEWATDHGARVANISYAVTGSDAVRAAAERLRSLGGMVTVSAGNSGSYDATAVNPAVITVAATGSGDIRTSWSSYGEGVDVAAPGSAIWTTANGGGYTAPSGTSFSSPATAAVIALMMSANPGLTPAELEAALFDSALDLGSEGMDIYYGHGRVDAGAAVLAALGNQQTDQLAPSVSIVNPVGGEVSGIVPVNVSASDNVGVSRVELYVNGQLLGSDFSSPYEFSWNSANDPDGLSVVESCAFDAAGNEGCAPPVEVDVVNNQVVADTTPPNVEISNPSAAATVEKTEQITVLASDETALALVELYIDGQLKFSSSSSFTYSWNTRKELTGAHTLTALAEDASGNVAQTELQVLVQSPSRTNKGKGPNK